MDWPAEIQRRYRGKALEEWQRLESTPITRVEYLITTHCLERYLPASGLILDAGSGPGRYALDLARKGYRVALCDLVREMLCLAAAKVAEAGLRDRATLTCGNLAALPYLGGRFDAVISLGAPLSHIPQAAGRRAAVAELARVTKPGGMVLLTCVQRLAGYRSAVYWFDEAMFAQTMTDEARAQGLVDGSQVWYLFAPQELEQMAQAAGMEVLDSVGCEGLANHLPLDHLQRIEEQPQLWPLWRRVLLETCNEPSIVGISNHLLVVARKP